MVSGPALRAFAIFHSSECADVVNVPGGRGAVAVDKSSAETAADIATRPIAALTIKLLGILLVGDLLALFTIIPPVTGQDDPSS
jgi:hypothetical protein